MIKIKDYKDNLTQDEAVELSKQGWFIRGEKRGDGEWRYSAKKLDWGNENEKDKTKLHPL